MLFKARLCGITEAHCFSLTKLLQKQVLTDQLSLDKEGAWLCSATCEGEMGGLLAPDVGGVEETRITPTSRLGRQPWLTLLPTDVIPDLLFLHGSLVKRIFFNLRQPMFYALFA